MRIHLKILFFILLGWSAAFGQSANSGGAAPKDQQETVDSVTVTKSYLKEFGDGYGYINYLVDEVTLRDDSKPWWQNYFYGLLLVSVFFLILEWRRPWRPNQPKFRKDFWLDFFYMFFNFFLFWLVIYNAFSNVTTRAFNDLLASFGFENLVAIEIASWPAWTQLIALFFVRDFIQWIAHRLLHRIPFLWEFHKVHHSVKEMGFAAHLRYHWMETVFYRAVEYIPLAMIGFGLKDFFVVHIFTLTVGHFNHSNITVSNAVKGAVFGLLMALFFNTWAWSLPWLEATGVAILGTGLGYFALAPLMPFMFNSPEMHIWHHAYELPENHKYGVNFGLTLSTWDYLFGTAYQPYNGRDIELGFPGVDDFPEDFWGQSTYGFGSKSSEKET